MQFSVGGCVCSTVRFFNKMSTGQHVVAMRERIGNWLNTFDDIDEDQLPIVTLINLIETLGFSATMVDKPQEIIGKADPTRHKYLIVNIPIESEENTTKCSIKNKQETKILSPTKKLDTRPIFSPKRSPLQDIEVSVNMGNITTSSPIKPVNKVADVLTKIISLAKDALDVVSDGNSTYSKPVFMRKRISDIRVSPLAMNESENKIVVDLNVTKTKENPSVLKATPKKKGAIIVKVDEPKKKPNASFTSKRSLPTPQGNLQHVRSKLRTPSQLKASPSITLTRSASAVGQKGTPSAIPGRMTTTPQKREAPIGFSRLKHPTVVKK